MKALIALLAAAALTPAAMANEQLAGAKGCTACHGVQARKPGLTMFPSYKEVAAKYKGDKAAAAKLAEKVQKGGTGVWGAAAMPPNNVTPDEAKQLVAWVLTVK